MTNEIAIVWGLGIISFILAYCAFELRESQEEFWKKVSIGLFFMAILFLNLIIQSIMLIAKNSVPYLEDSVIVNGLLIMSWTTIIIFFGFIIWVLFVSVQYTFALLMGKEKGDAGEM